MTWLCAWCLRIGDDDDHEPACAHCGRDIEAATWPRTRPEGGQRG